MNRRVLVGLILAMALPALDLMALGAAAPAIASDLGQLDRVAWLFVSYQLALVVSVPIYGKLGDLRGRRVVFLWSVAIFSVASVAAGLAWSFPMLVAARLVQGLGGGGIVSQTPAVIADLVPARERGRYSWVTPTVWTVAAFLGPVFGGALAEHLSWRWIFLINLPFGALAVALGRGAFPSRTSGTDRGLDRVGALLLVVSYGVLVLAVSVGGDLVAWSDPLVVAALVGGGCLLVGFVVHEAHTGDPLVPVSILRVRVVGASVATTFLIGSVNFMVVAFLPLMLQVVTGAGSTEAGLAILPTTLGIAVTSTIVGRIVVRTGYYRIWPIVGSVVFTAGYVVLARLGPDPAMSVVWMATALLGIGMGAGTPVFMLAMQNAVAHRDVGAVSAMAMFARNTGQVFGTAIAGAYFAARLGHYLGRRAIAASLQTASIDGVEQGVRAADLTDDVDLIASLDADVAALVADAVRMASTDVFTLGVVGALASLAAALFIPQVALRETLDEE